MTIEKAKKLKNGQYIQVKFSKYGKWRDALFVYYYLAKEICFIYATYMGKDRLVGGYYKYGTQSSFSLDEVRILKLRSK